MNQCVPSWDLDDISTPPAPRLSLRSSTPSDDVPMLDYEVAELTWENGQVAMHGLGMPRLPAKPSLTTAKYTTWDKPRASGTLESIVNQATSTLPPPSKPPFDSSGGGAKGEIVNWFDHHRAAAVRSTTAVAPSTTMTMDALVPCRNQSDNSSNHMMESMSMPGVISGSDMVGCSTRVESCSGATGAATQDDDTMPSGKHGSLSRVPETPEWSSRSQSVSGSATFGMDSQPVTLDSTKASDHDSVCHSRTQREAGDEDNRKKRSTGKSSVSTKRSRAAAIHNQSERKRRDKINQRMKTLQKLVPNSSKTDKASMLDEVIEYLKNLQAQIQMMSRMNMPAMMLPMAMQQQLQMSMMAAAPRHMGMGMGMDMNTMGRPNIPGIAPVLHPTAFMPMASWDGSGGDRSASATMPDHLSALLACQSQPMTMEAYGMMAAMYQQFHQPPASSSKS
ncbi:transcription factor UNE10 [Prunus yedoensis var. nudiflora]|uniref:Transcription factor UNE10 n=1 Tax=Prunus yedoensis var. nudiflora TaxID=2094558 RepID=A0A314U7M3_PRUYE|nr:transcription factor UNE10 [Prunus yedoensis var. nudiflora]